MVDPTIMPVIRIERSQPDAPPSQEQVNDWRAKQFTLAAERLELRAAKALAAAKECRSRATLSTIAADALNASPSPQEGRAGWQPIETAPNDGDFRWYGLHVQHTSGCEWFEAHYVQHDDYDQMRLPSGDNFDDWAFSDFEFWCAAPSPPSIAGKDQFHEREAQDVLPSVRRD